MSHVCPKGHFSTDQEFCSECGSPMSARSQPSGAPVVKTAAAPPVISASGAPGQENCPDCMTPRQASDRFCEVCRYDFSTRTSFSGLARGPGPSAAAPADVAKIQETVAAAGTSAKPGAATPGDSNPAPTPHSSAQVDSAASNIKAPVSDPAPLGPSRATGLLKLRIIVDPSLNTEPDPEFPCPTGVPEHEYHLDLDENTLGRQYEGKGVCPEIVVPDPGISRRHLKFVRTRDGSFSVLEIGSTNGTLVNGQRLEPAVVQPLVKGDQMTLGMWTRIYVEER